MNNKQKYTMILFAIVMFVIVTGIGIAYAAISQELYVNGNLNVNTKSAWKIKFTNLSIATIKGTAKEIIPPMINNDTKVGDYEVILPTPGDSITYEFDVLNDGTLDAELSSITISIPECREGDVVSQNARNVCNNTSHKLTYADGSTIQSGDILRAKESRRLKLSLEYSRNITIEELPKNDIKINNLSVILIYVQTK